MDKRDLRIIPFGLIALTLAASIYAEYVLGSYAVFARYLTVRPMPYFHDLGIWICGIDRMREGVDPYIVGCDEQRSYFNYPQVWAVFSLLPFVTEANLIIIGLFLVVLFFVSLYYFVGRCDALAAVVYTLLLLSPAVLVAVDRANSDLIIFLLMMLALWGRGARYFFAALFFAASMLKLFPAAAFMSILHNGREKMRQRLLLFLATCSAFLVYMVAWKDNLLVVNQQTPRPFGTHTFGLGEIPAAFVKYLHIANGPLATAAYGCFYALAILFGYTMYRRMVIPKVEDGRNGTAYLMGAGVFLAACVFGFNFEYRLVFLLFTIPQLLSWQRSRNSLAGIMIILSILIVWQSFFEDVLNLKTIHYHYFSQLLVAILFSAHLVTVCRYLLTIIKEGVSR